MNLLRSGLKAVVERAAGSRLAYSLLRHRRNGARVVLAYHNVVEGSAPPSMGDRSLHLPLRVFVDQLDAIQARGIRVARLEDPVVEGDLTPTVVITFDDAYLGALQLAIPELAKRGWPAVVFVAPGILGSSAPWWDRLASPVSGAIPPTVRDAALGTFGGEEARILAAAAANGWPEFPTASQHRIGTPQDLRIAMARHPGLALGAHSWSHLNLASLNVLDEAAIHREFSEPLAWLDAFEPSRAIRYLAYPYGLENQETRNLAARTGYSGALRVSGGWDSRVGDPFGIPRLNITPGLSRAGFLARLARVIRTA